MSHFEPFLRQLLSQSNSCNFFTDKDDLLTMISPSAKQYFVNTSQPLGSQSITQCIGCEHLRKTIEAAQTAFAQGQNSFQKLTPVNESGQQLNIRFHGDKVFADDGTFLGCTYTFAIEKSSQQLQFEATMLDNLMRNSEDLIYFKDLDSKFTCISQSMVKRVGAKNIDDVLGKSDFDFWDPVCAEVFYNDEQEIIRTGKPSIGKSEKVARTTGKEMWGISTKMPLIDEQGAIIGIFGISKDITSLKETERELDSTHKKLVDASRRAGMAEIATNVLHNVGNVLNSINVSISQTRELSDGLKIENLKKIAALLAAHSNEPNFLTEHEKGKMIPEYLSMIAEKLAKDRSTIENELHSTIGHLQHVKTIVAMQQKYATTSCVVEHADLSEIINTAIKMSSGSLERHQIKLIRDFESGIEMMLDKHQVLQILVNLIRNAKHAVQDAIQQQRTIKVAVVHPDAKSISIEVTDNGVGISPENMVSLFKHGFSTKPQGHGFGLHSGANSAKNLGGSLTAHSDGPGKGATFKLTLPIESAQAITGGTPIMHEPDVRPSIIGNSSNA